MSYSIPLDVSSEGFSCPSKDRTLPVFNPWLKIIICLFIVIPLHPWYN